MPSVKSWGLNRFPVKLYFYPNPTWLSSYRIISRLEPRRLVQITSCVKPKRMHEAVVRTQRILPITLQTIVFHIINLKWLESWFLVIHCLMNRILQGRGHDCKNMYRYSRALKNCILFTWLKKTNYWRTYLTYNYCFLSRFFIILITVLIAFFRHHQ